MKPAGLGISPPDNRNCVSVRPENDPQSGSEPTSNRVGPDLVAAATGIGAADLIATTISGSKYGYALLWAVVAGCIIKVALVTGAGRYTLATGNTIFEGWISRGSWIQWYFGPYIVIWGFAYGAAAMAGTGLAPYSLVSFASVGLGGSFRGCSAFPCSGRGQRPV